MPRHDIYIEIESRESVAGVDDLEPTPLPTLTQEDTLTLRIYLIKSPDQETFERVTTTGKTIEVSLGKKVGNSSTLYTQQFTWTANTDLSDPYWEANFPLDTPAIATLLGSKSDTNAWLEVVLIDSGDESTVLSKSIELHARVNKSGATAAAATETLLTVPAAKAMFPLISGFQGKQRWISPDGTLQADVYFGNDGLWHVEPVS